MTFPKSMPAFPQRLTNEKAFRTVEHLGTKCQINRETTNDAKQLKIIAFPSKNVH